MNEFEEQLLKTLRELKSVMVETNKGHVAIIQTVLGVSKILQTFKAPNPESNAVLFLETLPYSTKEQTSGASRR